MKPTFIVFFFGCVVITKIQCYDILLGVPMGTKSLHYLFSSLGLSLAEAGHNVTLFTSFNQTVWHPNLIHFQPADFSAPLARKPDNIFFNMSAYVFYNWIIETNAVITEMVWNSDEVWNLYKHRNEFEAIITPSYANEPLFPILDGYNGEYVVVCTPGVEYYTLSRAGNWLPPSVVPGMLVPYGEDMTFWERSNNLFSLLFLSNFLDKWPRRALKEEIRKYHPTVGDILKYYERSSLTLINGHFALDGPVPLLPNQVEIGTINAAKPKPLPKDLEKFMQGSGDAGVIYFSLGSFVLGNEIPAYIKDILLEAFRRVPQRVLWKYEDDDLDLPPNVMTRKWLPQQDILGHPKTKIFMSHCGNLGTQEAKYHGVPVLAVPIAFDQPRNAARLVRKGYGVIVDWKDITVKKLLEAVDTLTKNPEYYDRMKNISRILRDQKDSPAERAVWWVEYVIRHKGAPHLQYAGQRLSLYQYIMLDVIVFWSLVSFVIIYAIVWCCKKVFRKCWGSTKSKKAKKE